MVAAAVGELRLPQQPRANEAEELLAGVCVHERAVVAAEAGVGGARERLLVASVLGSGCTGRHLINSNEPQLHKLSLHSR